MVAKFLTHPLTRGLDIDCPETTALRRQIVREKRFLRAIYEEWYRALASAVPGGPGEVLELGSGGGFLDEFIPGLITSDVFPVPGVTRVVDAHALPFADGYLKAVVMTNVFHHLAQPRRFLAEAARCLRRGGVLSMIEPWHTAWSAFVYRRFHHEPFEPEADVWGFPSEGPLSSANGAMPWIVFERDRVILEREFPQLQVQSISPSMPFRYLLSGGVSQRGLMPAWTFLLWRWLEDRLKPHVNFLAMFAHVNLIRRETGESGPVT